MTSTIAHTTATRPAFLTRMADALSVPNGTFCFDPRKADEVKDGYTVAVFPDAEQWMSGRIDRDDVAAFMFANAREAYSAGVMVCGWRDPRGVAYLYLARVVDNRNYALKLARRTGNYVYTNLRTGVPVRTGIGV